MTRISEPQMAQISQMESPEGPSASSAQSVAWIQITGGACRGMKGKQAWQAPVPSFLCGASMPGISEPQTAQISQMESPEGSSASAAQSVAWIQITGGACRGMKGKWAWQASVPSFLCGASMPGISEPQMAQISQMELPEGSSASAAQSVAWIQITGGRKSVRQDKLLRLPGLLRVQWLRA